MSNSFTNDFKWQSTHIPEATKIILDNIQHIIDVKIAPDSDDIHRCTDLIVKISGGKIGLRMRRNRDFQDFTVRNSRPNGTKTERDKIISGCIQSYLYIWFENDKVADWILINIDKMNELKLFSDNLYGNGKIVENRDGTTFISYSLSVLRELNCILAEGWDMSLNEI
jgi:hypothetical protein